MPHTSFHILYVGYYYFYLSLETHYQPVDFKFYKVMCTISQTYFLEITLCLLEKIK